MMNIKAMITLNGNIEINKRLKQIRDTKLELTTIISL